MFSILWWNNDESEISNSRILEKLNRKKGIVNPSSNNFNAEYKVEKEIKYQRKFIQPGVSKI